MAENEARKRDMISFLINAQVRKSAASCRFVEEYRASGEHAEKREKVVAALRSGQLLDEAGLQPVMAFLDTEGFENLDVRQRQLLILARMQDFLGVTPQSAPVAVPVVPVQQPPAPKAPPVPQEQPQASPATVEPETSVNAEPEPSEPVSSDTPEPAEPTEPAKPANKRMAAFADKLSG